MKKILLGFIFLSLSSLIYSNELWNGLKFGMPTLEARHTTVSGTNF